LVFPLKNKNEVGIGFVKILRDITAKKVAGRNKKYAKELEELMPTRKMYSRFVS
jgi:hypothetical protein